MAFEVEQKFRLTDSSRFKESLASVGWDLTGSQTNRDAYFNHPCKDFATTGEALRVRQIDGIGHVTYKGPKLAGPIKAREEIEWPLGESDLDGAKTERLLTKLDFRPVAVVTKSRSIYVHPDDPDLTLVFDEVDQLGQFVEIEMVVPGPEGVKMARQRIATAAAKLGLDQAESRSYLTMLLQKRLESNP